MRLLALATSGPRAAVGTSDGGPADVTPLGSGAERGRSVTAAMDAALARRDWKPHDLQGVAVDVGPGSFTGVRVGVATAKALALGLGVPVVGVSSLDALASAAGPTSSTILALRDARSGEAYFAIYTPPIDDASPPRRLSRLARGRVEAVRAALEERGLAKALAVGEDAERLAVTMPLAGLLSGVRTPFAGPDEVLALARPRFLAGTTDDADALAPSYLQPSTPEARLAAKER